MGANVYDSATAPKVRFFPTGGAFFIYTGAHEARKRGKYKHEIFKRLLELQQKNTTLKRRCQVLFEFLSGRQLQGQRYLLGNVQLLWLENKVLPFCRLLDGRKEGKDCVIAESNLKLFQFHLLPNRKTKCWRSVKERGKPQAFSFFNLFIFPDWGTAVAVSQYFPGVFFGSPYLVPTIHNKSRRELLGWNKIPVKMLSFLLAHFCSTGGVWFAYTCKWHPSFLELPTSTFWRHRLQASLVCRVKWGGSGTTTRDTRDRISIFCFPSYGNAGMRK